MDGMDGGKHNSDNTESAPKKKIYHITQSSRCIQYWYYEVEAESEEEALGIVQDGDAEAVDHEIDGNLYFGVNDDYEVTDVKEIK